MKTILASQRAKGSIAIATASTGLEATLLPGGRTVHSTFKVPPNIINAETPSCSIKKGTALSRVVQDASLLIVDEVTLLHKKVIEAIDTILKDIRSSSEVMGGLLTLLCGDFRQILPVIRQGARANIVDACFKSSSLWRLVQQYRLTTNMRVALQADERAEMFANKLLRLGNCETDTVQSPDYVPVLNFGTPAEHIDILLDRIYPQIHSNYENHTWLMQRAILAPHNDSISQINNLLAEKLPTQTHTYTAINSVVDEEQAVQFPVEFLTSIEVSELPPSVLDLKCGMPVMLLRSIKPTELMNGTRCIIHNCNRHFVEVVIGAGIYSGQHHLIPRIPLRPSDTMFPFQFERKQFPLRLCFALTINKAQGQTLKVIGLGLRQTIFAHDGNTLDFHHMSVPDAMSETIKYLKLREKEYIESGYRKKHRYLTFITGKGDHSEDGIPKIKPEVKKYLENHGFM
ncbi:ATP-dependent DNA helicase PIF1 [Elysia marginata]|uniref:ATP-dependent DNA helicase n=1 Tax=Elysia marginata TaxID=1093978 RepID=A0AAV4HTX1_9GAST|nr:ATP-dependent DNA helicase PIF1 [Elysia marginata]